MQKRAWKRELGEQIRAAREGAGITQDDLATLVKTTRGSINSYETGRGNPQFKVVAEIAVKLKADFEILGCRIAYAELIETPRSGPAQQLQLRFDQDHSFLANVTIRPTKKSITITTHSDFGIKSA